MEQSFSFRWIKLGIAIIFLLGSSLLPNLYLIIALGGIALMTAFASFGNYDYRGIPSKLSYRIIRYVIAVLLLAVAAIQIYVQIAMPNTVHFSPYSTVVDVALIAYLLMYKPSDATTKKKIMKVVGYTAILVSVNALQNSQKTVEYMTHTTTEINWGAMFASAIVMIIGIVSLLLSNKKS